MSTQCEVTAKKAAGSPMAFFERYLSLWVFLCIAVGIGLGQLFPGFFQFIGRLEVAQINLPVAVMIWLMIIPMLLKIDLKALKGVTQHWRGRDPVRQLCGQSLFHGVAGLAGHPRPVCRLAASGADRQLHRRTDPTGRRALHRDGVRISPGRVEDWRGNPLGEPLSVSGVSPFVPV